MSSGFSGFSSNFIGRPTTAIEVLESIVAKLRTYITDCSNDSTCFMSDCPAPSIEIQGNHFITVCMSDGHFDQQQMDGGGNVQVVEMATIVVTAHSRVESDQLEHFYHGLTDINDGLLTRKRQILTALAGKNLDGGPYAGGGSSSSGSPDSLLLMEPLFPSSSRIGDKMYDEFASTTLNFDAKFRWNLNSDSLLS